VSPPPSAAPRDTFGTQSLGLVPTFSDAQADLVLNGEEVIELAIEVLRPELAAILPVD
jgi:hypothetical protein